MSIKSLIHVIIMIVASLIPTLPPSTNLICYWKDELETEGRATSRSTNPAINLVSSFNIHLLPLFLRSSPANGAIGSSFLPAAPSIFYGRQETVDAIVEAIVEAIMTREPARIVVLGTGGVGKVNGHVSEFDHL